MTAKLMTGNEALAWGALHAGVKVVTGYPGTPSTGALTSLLKMNPAGRPRRVERQREGRPRGGRRGGVGRPARAVHHEDVGPQRLLRLADLRRLLRRARRARDLCGRRPRRQRRHARAGLARVCDHGRPADARAGVRRRGLPDDQDGVRPLGGDRHAGVHPPGHRQLGLVRAGRPRRRPARVAGARGRADPRHQQVHQGRRGDLHGPAPRPHCAPRARGPLDRRSRARTSSRWARRAASASWPRASRRPTWRRASRSPRSYGFEPEAASVLRVKAVHPFPAGQAQALLRHCDTILVLEELEPHLEKRAPRAGAAPGLCPRGSSASWTARSSASASTACGHVVQGLAAALDLAIPADLFEGRATAESFAAARPITVCAGCPHRGTFMAINKAVRKAGFKKDEVMVTGDIGCTILGMNPPFNTVWTEVSMGASHRPRAGLRARGRQDARHRHHRRLDLLPCGHPRAHQRRTAPGAAHAGHHGQRLDEHDRHAGQPGHLRGLSAAGRPQARPRADRAGARRRAVLGRRPVRGGRDDGDPQEGARAARGSRCCWHARSA